MDNFEETVVKRAEEILIKAGKIKVDSNDYKTSQLKKAVKKASNKHHNKYYSHGDTIMDRAPSDPELKTFYTGLDKSLMEFLPEALTSDTVSIRDIHARMAQKDKLTDDGLEGYLNRSTLQDMVEIEEGNIEDLEESIEYCKKDMVEMNARIQTSNRRVKALKIALGNL